MIHMRRIVALAIALLGIQLVAGCALFEDELLPNRQARVLAFPVRGFEFERVSCRQEFEHYSLSGALRNISYSPVSDVQVRVELFLADQSAERFMIPVDPPLLQPSEAGEFSLEGKVEQPISHVDLHVHWSDYYPPGL